MNRIVVVRRFGVGGELSGVVEYWEYDEWGVRCEIDVIG